MSGLPEEARTRAALHAALLASDSATAVLERFFGQITAQRVAMPVSEHAGLAERLQLSPGDDLRHRAVKLLAGTQVLSEAELWYVANRLPADRVAQLESSSTPFGRIMMPLGLKRSVLLSRICAADEPSSLIHHAILTAPSGRPMAEVYERYAKGLFGAS